MKLNDLGPIAIALVVFAIVLGIGSTILENVSTQFQPSGFNESDTSTWDISYNVTQDGQQGLDTMASYQTTVAIVAVAAIIVGIVLMFFGRQF